MRKTWCTQQLKKGSADYYRHLAGLEWAKGNQEKAINLERKAVSVQASVEAERRQCLDQLLDLP